MYSMYHLSFDKLLRQRTPRSEYYYAINFNEQTGTDLLYIYHSYM